MARSQRKILNLQVKKSFQRWLLLQVTGAVLLSAGLAAVVLYFYARQEVGESFYSAHVAIRRVSDLLLPVILAGTAVSLVAGGLLALFLPQKIAGPLYRFEESLRQLGEGDLTVKVVLRKGDILVDFADTVNETIEQLRERVTVIQQGLPEDGGDNEAEKKSRQELHKFKT